MGCPGMGCPACFNSPDKLPAHERLGRGALPHHRPPSRTMLLPPTPPPTHTPSQVGCLRKSGRGELHALPEGDWFCSEECRECHTRIGALVGGAAAPASQPCPAVPPCVVSALCSPSGRLG